MDEDKMKEMAARADALQAENATLKADNARLQEALLLREAIDFVVSELAGVTMPEPTRRRLTEALATKPAIKDGALDKETYAAQISDAAKGELAYLASITKPGEIRGMGASLPPSSTASLLESFESFYRKLGKSADEAKTLATIAAGGR